MTAALTGRPLLALLLACYVGAVLLLARFCGAGAAYDRCPDDEECGRCGWPLEECACLWEAT